ncbi:MAG: ribbon-helix-helix protein, CopG family [Acidobacteria bacterium]|nr:MAG: ribbon-helix-helix protein, CopG family [Acidobacteriota bacterium]
MPASKAPRPAAKRPRQTAKRPVPETPHLPDAEDIALARLQAQLRRTEALPNPPRRSAAPGRTSLRLPADLLQRLRGRARREGVTLTRLVQVALEQYLKQP